MEKEGKMSKKDKQQDKSIELLVENSIALQKILTSVSYNLTKLTEEITLILELFKEASKTFGEERATEEVDFDHKRNLISKLDVLIEQNKHIARGLILLESTLRDREKPRDFKF